MKLNAFMIAILVVLNSFSQDFSASFIMNEEDCNKYKSLYYTYLILLLSHLSSILFLFLATYFFHYQLVISELKKA